MCDPAQILFRRPFHAVDRSVCAATALVTNSGIVCYDTVLGTSFTVTLSEDPVAIWAAQDFVCWTDQEGRASCSNGASTPSIRVSDIQAIRQRFSLLNDKEFVSQSAIDPLAFTFPTVTSTLLTTGPDIACVVLPTSQSSFSCQVSVTGNVAPSSVTSNPGGFYGSPIADFRVNTTTVWWTNEATSISWFGVPGCGGTTTYCSSASVGDRTIFNIPTNTTALRVSPGFWQVCAVTPQHSLSCWGSYSSFSGWQTLSSVIDVFVYNGGGCAVFQSYSSATCWGQFSKTFPLLYQKTCAPCSVSSSIVFNDACLPCGFGSESSVTAASQSAWCVPCPSLYVRGSTDTVCVQCAEGTQPNTSLTQCTSCLPSQYRSTTMASCTACGEGSQSYAGGASCTSCTLPLYRSSTMASCSACPSGSLPNASQTACLACPLPQYCSATSPMTFEDCTCVLCPNGFQVSGFGCASCTAPNIRLSPSQTCYACPEGTEPNTSFTACLACTGNFVRTNPSPNCFACPTNTLPNASHTRCESVIRPFKIEGLQYVFVGLGLLSLLISAGLSSFSPAWASTAGIFGVLFIAFGAAWPVTLNKPNPP